eukprot:Protomagalhaensia_sp_Gyna_25__5324@NODE_66_length_5710_cov_131_847117_g49_i0_p2_GENE_NODE_66_length_5710_cov_131_847117_g49_i0NODE_66_length_5710_cov_131_847117_g49_i0_p2_ORF_typecomplete_len297_score55_88FKBP_C/PF00254_28/1_9e32TPR_19/PF14559_6/0_00072TPR_19/PF14559_6/2_1e09TPR_16/PF13432_6/4_3e06TPR_16/PF13432_6/3_5e05TPR_11/PF13414_6/3_4e03TPR_11/PF13414_6/2e05TPR_11/PF13414_6/0_78TPR_11/PF13414_6/0_0032TPR_1/PF00515_28/0_00076TPR_1/PF00515_28/9_7TPR_1/PF00515_28/3e03TPR_1/PF00515_28/0_00038T
MSSPDIPVPKPTPQSDPEFVDLLGNGKVLKAIIQPGTGERPPVNSDVRVHYRGTLLDGTEFDSSYKRNEPFTFTIGEGQVIKGWDVGVASMAVGETADLKISPDFAYGERGSPPTIPAQATLMFRVELLSFKPKKKQPHQLTPEERVSEATSAKAQGNDFFKNGKLSEAIEAYKEATEMLTDFDGFEASLKEASEPLKLAAHLNLANCYLKTKLWLPCVLECTAALQLAPENTKASYRRGLARMELGEFDEASKDLTHAARLDPRDPQIRQAVTTCKARGQAARQKESQTYAKMFP